MPWALYDGIAFDYLHSAREKTLPVFLICHYCGLTMLLHTLLHYRMIVALWVLTDIYIYLSDSNTLQAFKLAR